MTNAKSTKRSLLTSAVALVICFAMLIGTTFAWFTDSVTSANNVIKSGNLDIELEYWNGEKWVDVKGKSDILTNTLWEPGVTEVAYLRVANAGSLALKYQLGINVVSETAGVNAAGESFLLSDYIMFGVVEGVNGQSGAYANREDAVAAVNGAKKISAGYGKSSTMLSGDELYLALVVYMPTTVGNEANHNGTDVPEIELGINVLATQLTHEDDSFGNDYDEDSTLVNTIVTSEEELVAALAAAKNGDVIGIDGNITWTTGAGHGSTPFVTNATFITLQGIGENPTFTAIGQGVGPVGIDGGTVYFKDLTIVDQSVSYAESSWEFGYLEFRGNTVFENCDIVNAVMMEGESATFTNCTLNSGSSNEYAVWVSDGTATFEGCTFTGARGLKVHEAYGSEVVSVSVNNSKFLELSKKPGVALGDLNTETSISFTNNQFIGTQPGDQGNYKYESDTDTSTFAFVDENNIVAGAGTSATAGLYISDDGTYFATTTNGLNAGISAAQDGDTVVLGGDVTYTGTGYANITKNITLDLNGNNIDTTSLGVVAKAGTIKNGTITNPVGSRAALRTWSGVSIENVTIVSPENGGITVASGNTLPYIKDVTIVSKTYGIELQYGASVGLIENVTITAGQNGIVAQAATVGEIKNCTINGENCGVWAQLKGTTNLELAFTNCTVSGGNYGIYVCDEGATIVPDGVAKVSYDSATTFDGSLKAKEFAFGQEGKLYINGGKIALIISTKEELFAFAKAVNEGNNAFAGLSVFMNADVDLENELWTPIGQTGATQFRGTFDGDGHTISNLKIDSSANTGKNYASGLFGWLNKAIVKNVNVDKATVIANHNVGVIAGYMETSGCTISNCNVTNSTVTATHVNDDVCGDKIGVIVGYANNAGIKVENCSATDCTVVAGRDAGQIAGAAKTANVVGCSATNVEVRADGSCTGANVRAELIGRVL